MLEEIKLNIEKLIWITAFYFVAIAHMEVTYNLTEVEKNLLFVEFLIALFLPDLDIFFRIIKNIFIAFLIISIAWFIFVIFFEQDIAKFCPENKDYCKFSIIIGLIVAIIILKILDRVVSKVGVFHSFIGIIVLTICVHFLNGLMMDSFRAFMATMCFLIGYLSHFKFEKIKD